MDTDEGQVVVLGWGAGALVYLLGIKSVSPSVFKVLSIHASHPLAKPLGLLSVGIFGLCGGLVADYLMGQRIESNTLGTYSGLSVLSFLILGGKPQQVLPANVLMKGPFASESIPIRFDVRRRFATAGEKKLIQKIGSKHGCHHCGRRKTLLMQSVHFVADHIPPMALRVPGHEQRLFPQCQTCSTKQSWQVVVAQDLILTPRHFLVIPHTLRVWMLWPPLPLGSRVLGAKQHMDRSRDIRL